MVNINIKSNPRLLCKYMYVLHLSLTGSYRSHFPVRYCVAYNQTIYVELFN